MVRDHQPTADPQHSASVGSPTMHIEIHLREAGRGLELLGVTDPESARLAGVVFRLAQRVAVDAGRLEPAA
jgi:hypothetical protein